MINVFSMLAGNGWEINLVSQIFKCMFKPNNAFPPSKDGGIQL